MQDQPAGCPPNPPTGGDPFDLLGLRHSFELAPGEIRRAHRARVAAVHPDVSDVGSSEHATAAVLNSARDELLDPERRANVLLARLGGPAASDDKSLPDGFLMEIMELRTEVEAALAQGESARAAAQQAAETQRAEMISAVTKAFASLGDAPDRAALASIRTRLNAWRYIERLVEQLDPEYDPARADFAG
ncbi:MAG: iron-sulfur cluster co-chaperone HscB C-terminal domain-containing protein [Planctomycetota bacterium]